MSGTDILPSIAEIKNCFCHYNKFCVSFVYLHIVIYFICKSVYLHMIFDEYSYPQKYIKNYEIIQIRETNLSK